LKSSPLDIYLDIIHKSYVSTVMGTAEDALEVLKKIESIH
jgi:hypothetical protein